MSKLDTSHGIIRNQKALYEAINACVARTTRMELPLFQLGRTYPIAVWANLPETGPSNRVYVEIPNIVMRMPSLSHIEAQIKILDSMEGLYGTWDVFTKIKLERVPELILTRVYYDPYNDRLLQM